MFLIVIAIAFYKRKTDRNAFWGLFYTVPREKLICMCLVSWVVEAGYAEKDRIFVSPHRPTTAHGWDNLL